MNTIKRIPIAETKKGHRVWIQGLESYGWAAGTVYKASFEGADIVYRKADKGRTVTAGKGGVIDTTSKKVTQWATTTSGHTFTSAEAVITADTITIMRAA